MVFLFGSPFVSPQTREMFVQTEQNMQLRKKKNTQSGQCVLLHNFQNQTGKLGCFSFQRLLLLLLAFPNSNMWVIVDPSPPTLNQLVEQTLHNSFKKLSPAGLKKRRHLVNQFVANL